MLPLYHGTHCRGTWLAFVTPNPSGATLRARTRRTSTKVFVLIHFKLASLFFFSRRAQGDVDAISSSHPIVSTRACFRCGVCCGRYCNDYTAVVTELGFVGAFRM